MLLFFVVFDWWNSIQSIDSRPICSSALPQSVRAYSRFIFLLVVWMQIVSFSLSLVLLWPTVLRSIPIYTFREQDAHTHTRTHNFVIKTNKLCPNHTSFRFHISVLGFSLFLCVIPTDSISFTIDTFFRLSQRTHTHNPFRFNCLNIKNVFHFVCRFPHHKHTWTAVAPTAY